jgi:hypothetical protein
MWRGCARQLQQPEHHGPVGLGEVGRQLWLAMFDLLRRLWRDRRRGVDGLPEDRESLGFLLDLRPIAGLLRRQIHQGLARVLVLLGKARV